MAWILLAINQPILVVLLQRAFSMIPINSITKCQPMILATLLVRSKLTKAILLGNLIKKTSSRTAMDALMLIMTLSNGSQSNGPMLQILTSSSGWEPQVYLTSVSYGDRLINYSKGEIHTMLWSKTITQYPLSTETRVLSCRPLTCSEERTTSWQSATSLLALYALSSPLFSLLLTWQRRIMPEEQIKKWLVCVQFNPENKLLSFK